MLKVLYLLGNITEQVGTSLEYDLVGKQLTDILCSQLKSNIKNVKESRDRVVAALRLFGNLAMDERYQKDFVNNKMTLTLLKIFLASKDLDSGIVLGVMHNLSSFEWP